MKNKKIVGIIVSKDYQQRSNNYKLEIVTNSRQQKFFFYSQQKHQKKIKEIEEKQEYSFFLFKDRKYWFLETWERKPAGKVLNSLDKRKEEILESNLQLLKKQWKVQQLEKLEKRLNDLKEQIVRVDNPELVFLEYFEQFTNLLLIKHLEIRNKPEAELTELEKKEQEILSNIVTNWFYRAV